MHKPVFEGLVVDENDQPLKTTYIGDEPCYVINDDGFMRHVPSEEIDRQVMNFMQEQLTGKEDLIASESAKMIGQEDLFTRAMILNQLKNMDKQFNQLLETGIPQEGRAYLGMLGFKVVVNVHGEVVHVIQPSQQSGDEDGE
jgi:hypothetical protein